MCSSTKAQLCICDGTSPYVHTLSAAAPATAFSTTACRHLPAGTCICCSKYKPNNTWPLTLQANHRPRLRPGQLQPHCYRGIIHKRRYQQPEHGCDGPPAGLWQSIYRYLGGSPPSSHPCCRGEEAQGTGGKHSQRAGQPQAAEVRQLKLIPGCIAAAITSTSITPV